MTEFLPFIVSGIASGAVIGLAATGLVLTYKSSGIFNFGHGAIATLAAYTFYWLHEEHGVHWIPAMLVAVIGIGLVSGLVLERISARLMRHDLPLQIVATIGIVLVVQGLAVIQYGLPTIRMEPFLPKARDSFRVADVVITYDRVIVTSVAVIAVGFLYGLFRFAQAGVAMRAVVDDPDLLAMQGVNPGRVRRTAWFIGATFAALSGVLLAPMLGLDSILLTFLVVQAFAAAAVGALSSIPLTFAGALMIGVAADVSKKYAIQHDWLSGFPSALPFIVLLLVLLLMPRDRLVPPSVGAHRTPIQYRSPTVVRVVMGAALLGVLLLVPTFAGTKLTFWIQGLILAIMLLSLGLLVRISGQVSLCHAAFAAIGAVTFSQLRVDHGWPWLLALLGAGLVVVPVGALVAIPAVRLSGLYLALATFGFGILVQRLLYNESFMFTAFAQGRAMPRPSFASSREGFYYVVLAILVLAALATVAIVRSRLGRLLQGMAGSQTAVTAMGLNVTVSKVIVFCISAFMAGIAGALYGVLYGFAVAGDRFFLPFNSLVLLAMLALAPFAEPWFALVALGGVIPGYITGGNTYDWLNVFFGVFAVLVGVRGGHPSMPHALRARLDRFQRTTAVDVIEPTDRPPAVRVDPSRAGLRVENLVVRFDGLQAVGGASLAAPLGRITGLIGPNGAGKTTTFNACSGLVRVAEGHVTLHDADVTSLSPPARANRGLGRTFQRMELFESLTVRDNVILGREASQAGSNPLAQVFAPPGEWKDARAAAEAAMDLCGISHLAGEQAGALSTGQARLVEFARCIAGPFDLLLLDEPSSGLDHAETARFGELLQRVVEERGVGILLVEHDMSLVMRVCSYVYVLDFGSLIFEGPTDELARSEVVRAAYLGTDHLAANEHVVGQ